MEIMDAITMAAIVPELADEEAEELQFVQELQVHPEQLFGQHPAQRPVPQEYSP